MKNTEALMVYQHEQKISTLELPRNTAEVETRRYKSEYLSETERATLSTLALQRLEIHTNERDQENLDATAIKRRGNEDKD